MQKYFEASWFLERLIKEKKALDGMAMEENINGNRRLDLRNINTNLSK